MVHVNGVLLVLSSVILAGIAAPAVHERALSSSASHPVAEHVVLDERPHEGVELEERQHLVNAKMEAAFQEEVSHLQVHQSAKAAEEEAEDVKAVAKSGAAAVDRIMNYIQMISRDADVLDRSVAAVTRSLTVSQGLTIQRQFTALTMSLAQGTRVIQSARPLTFAESRQLLVAIRVFENNFLDLITITIAKKTTFARLPFRIMPYIGRALQNLGSMTDGFEAALEGVVAPSTRPSVDMSRRTLARAFRKAYVAYA